MYREEHHLQHKSDECANLWRMVVRCGEKSVMRQMLEQNGENVVMSSI